MNKTIFPGILAPILLLAAVSVPGSAEGISIHFEKRLYADDSPAPGLGNIFFAKAETSPERFPQEWKDIEEADLFRSSETRPVKVYRYRSGSSGFKYALDPSGRNDPLKAANLEFRSSPDGTVIADVWVTVQAAGLPFQVILSEKEGYAYSRIAEYREGRVAIGGTTYAIQWHHSSAGEFRFDSGNSACLIDRDRDGEFRLQAGIGPDGAILESDQVDLEQPFMLGGKAWRAAGMDPDGLRLDLIPTTEKIALAVGFLAPSFVYRDLDGRDRRLEESKGKVVLLDFWSTDCYWSEKIRPEMNALIEAKKDAPFLALGVAFKSGTLADLRTFLIGHPGKAAVVVADEASLKSYNRREASPLFYLVDGAGVIRHIGLGAAQVPVLRKKIDDLVNK